MPKRDGTWPTAAVPLLGRELRHPLGPTLKTNGSTPSEGYDKHGRGSLLLEWMKARSADGVALLRPDVRHR
jgi:hypothetical protein